jgi:putative ABC transport system permease protein
MRVQDVILRAMRWRDLVVWGGGDSAEGRRRTDGAMRWYIPRMVGDVKHAWRRISASPIVSFAVILTAGAAIAAVAAAFALVHGVLLRQQPFSDADRLVAAQRHPLDDGGRVSLPELLDWRARNQVFVELAGYETNELDLVTQSGAVPLVGAVVTPSFFSVVLSVPLLGELPIGESWDTDGLPAAVLTERLWRTQFGADRTVVGRAVRLNSFDSSQTYRIAGVVATAASLHLTEPYDLYVPVPRMATDAPASARRAMGFYAVGRLKPGITHAQATDDLKRIVFQLLREFPTSPESTGAGVIRLDQAQFGETKSRFVLLSVAVLSLLLIACINIAALLLASGISRLHEISVMTALGMTRRRLMRHLMAEYLTLAAIGGALGCGLGLLVTRSIVFLAPADLPRLDEVSFDWLAVLVTVLVTFVAGVVFGALPTAVLANRDLMPLLKADGETVVGTRTLTAWRELLVAAQLGVVFALMIGAGLLMNSLYRLSHIDLGFDPENVVALEMSVGPRVWQATDRYVAFQTELLERVRALPDVAAATLTFSLPPYPQGRMAVGLRDGERVGGVSRVVTSGYFDALKIPLLRGRDFPVRPDYRLEKSVIVNDAFASRYLAGNPLGQYVQTGPEWRAVIAVVGNAREWNIREKPDPTLYLPFSPPNVTPRRFSLVVRTANPAVVPTLRSVVSSMDAEVPITETSIRRRIAADHAENRFYALTLSAFAGFGTLLAAVAVFAMTAERVSERRREFAVRIAYGASPRTIMWLVWRRVLPLFALGSVLGILGAWLYVGSLRHLLFEVSPTDWTTGAAVLGAFLSITAIAAHLAARQATTAEPSVLLRSQ